MAGRKPTPVWGKSKKKLTEAEADRLADLALEIEPEDDIVRAGSDPELGFGAAIAVTRQRSAQLVAMPRDGEPTTDEYERDRKRIFLQSMAMTQNVSMSAGAAGWTRLKALAARKTDKSFAEAWDEAEAMSVDFFEAELIRRAVHGVEKEVWHKGEVVGYETVYSDKLLSDLVKATNRKKYGDRMDVKQDITKRKGVLRLGPKLSTEEWEAEAGKNQAKYRENRRDDG